MYGHVISKFSRMGSLPHFLTQGAPQARLARQSAVNILFSKGRLQNPHEQCFSFFLVMVIFLHARFGKIS